MNAADTDRSNWTTNADWLNTLINQGASASDTEWERNMDILALEQALAGGSGGSGGSGSSSGVTTTTETPKLSESMSFGDLTPETQARVRLGSDDPLTHAYGYVGVLQGAQDLLNTGVGDKNYINNTYLPKAVGNGQISETQAELIKMALNM